MHTSWIRTPQKIGGSIIFNYIIFQWPSEIDIFRSLTLYMTITEGPDDVSTFLSYLPDCLIDSLRLYWNNFTDFTSNYSVEISTRVERNTLRIGKWIFEICKFLCIGFYLNSTRNQSKVYNSQRSVDEMMPSAMIGNTHLVNIIDSATRLNCSPQISVKESVVKGENIA